ncbi:endonuclease III [Mycoplasmatota bacterium zrk1]
MNSIKVIEQMFPNAKCELIHENEFELLIAVMLSAQTTDESVNKLTDHLFSKYKKPVDYLNVPITELEGDLRKLGLYRRKALNIRSTCQLLIDKYKGVVPNTRDELISLPGVGRKTANVILGVAFNEPAIPVDTHVERVSKRLGFAEENDSAYAVEKKLMNILPKDKWNEFHHQIIFFGRYHCTARSPHCEQCELTKNCIYFKSRLLK